MMTKKNRLDFVLLIITISGFFSQYLVNVYLAHHLDINIFGDYSIASKCIDIVASVVLFGTDINIVTTLSVFLKNHYKASIDDYMAWNIHLVGFNILLIRILSFCLFIIMIGLHLAGIKKIGEYPLIIYILWGITFAAPFKMLVNLLICYKYIISSIFFKNALINITQLLLFYVAFNVFYTPHYTYLMLGIALILNYGILSLGIWLILHKKIRCSRSFGLKKITHQPLAHSNWLTKGRDILLNNMIFETTCALDFFIVRFFDKNSVEVGYYAAILTINAILILIPKSLYQQLRATLSYELTTLKGRALLQEKINRISQKVFIIVTSLGIFLMVFSTQLLSLFGETFSQAQTALIFATVGLWFAGTGQIAGGLLICGNHEKLVIKPTILQLFLTILCTIPATYFYGIEGTTASTSLILIINTVQCKRLVKKHQNIQLKTIPDYFVRKEKT